MKKLLLVSLLGSLIDALLGSSFDALPADWIGSSFGALLGALLGTRIDLSSVPEYTRQTPSGSVFRIISGRILFRVVNDKDI